jgi:rfaE bifunctional protein nucleotidyltransferase chain/domain
MIKKKVVFGGCFDLLHAGHIMAINEAKKQGDWLTIQLASDHEIMIKKGISRPIVPEQERKYLLEQIKAVDEVVIWPGVHNPIGILKALKPDVLILNAGGQYPVEEAVKEELGFEICYIPRFIPNSGLDTTKIIDKVLNGYST